MAEPEKKTDASDSPPRTPANQDAQSAGEPSTAEQPTDSNAGAAIESPSDRRADAETEAEEHYEPLTPELFADESRRGDFVITVVTVLLGFLLAMFKIGDVPFWGHLAMGRHIVENGPPHSDPFSYAVQDEPSVAPNWLTEAAMYTIYSNLGASMLVFLKALGGVLLALLLLGIRRPGPTLWATACGGGVALAMTGQDFVVGPEFITLLGLAVYLALMHRIRHMGQAKLMWLFVPLQALWVNLDERAFVGLLFVLLFLIGELAARRLSMAQADRLMHKEVGRLAAVFGLMLLASLANPYGVHALVYPFHYYVSMKPALVDYWSETGAMPFALMSLLDRFNALTQEGSVDTFFMQMRPLEFFNAVLLFAALISFTLNTSRFDVARLVVLAGFACLAGLSLGTLALFTLVSVTVLVMNGQEWYLDRFGTKPRIEVGWLVWSRGGRAVTVLGLAVVAVLGSAGWLRGTNGYDFGLGIHPLMEESLAAMREQLDDLPPETRGFNMTLDQATVLAWIAPGEQTHLAHMNEGMALYAGVGGNGWREYLQLRNQLIFDNPAVWRPVFDKYGVGYAMISMTPPARLDQFAILMVSRNWVPVSLGGSLSLFVRADAEGTSIADYREKHALDFIRAAYRESHEVPSSPAFPVEAPNWLYDPLWRTRHVVPEGIARAEHLWQLPQVLNNLGPVTLTQAISLNLLAIRSLRESLASRYVDNPNGYLLLAAAYEQLFKLESRLTERRLEGQMSRAELGQLPVARQPHNVRFYQLLTALNQAVTADPKSSQAHGKLAFWYFEAKQWDLALHHYEALVPLLRDEEEISKAMESIVRLTDRVESIRSHVEEEQRKNEFGNPDASPFESAQLARRLGCPMLAFELAANRSYGFLFDANVHLVLAHLYTELGQPFDADEQLDPLTNSGPQLGSAYDELRGTILLLQGYYNDASARWLRAIEAQRKEVASDYLMGLHSVFTSSNPLPFFEQADKAAQQPLRTASGLLHLGMMLMEAGEVEQAAERLKESLEADPEAPFRVLTAFYLNRLIDDKVDTYRPSDYVPVVFAEATETP